MVQMDDTSRLLSEFTENRSESAFAEIVRRYLNLVYSTALRRVGGDAAQAQDIAQTVFADLARKAASLPPRVILAGWLYRHTTFVASTWVRAERRRQLREHTAMDLHALNRPQDWSAVGPVLEDAMQELPDRDRDALVLRFLDRQPFTQVGAALGVSEDAARMRVERGLERLRGLLARRGVTSAAGALALALAHHGTLAAPAGLATTIASAALAASLTGAGTAGIGTATTIGTLHLMATPSLKIGLAALVAAGATTVAVLQHRQNTDLRARLQLAIDDLDTARADREAAAAHGRQLEADAAAWRAQRVQVMDLRNKAARLIETERELAALKEQAARLAQAPTAAPKAEPAPEQAAAEQEAQVVQGLMIARMQYLRGWSMAFLQFADQNDGWLPSTFAEASAFLAEDDRNSAVGVLDPERFEIVYRGRLQDLPNPARTIIVREREAFTHTPAPGAPPAAMRTYLFADGHTEIYRAPDGQFDRWEQERMVAPTSSGPRP